MPDQCCEHWGDALSWPRLSRPTYGNDPRRMSCWQRCFPSSSRTAGRQLIVEFVEIDHELLVAV
jgi:hypothetical protein